MEKFKRFIVFGYSSYYPLGGMTDVIGDFDTVEECLQLVSNDNNDYHDIFDCDKRVKVEYKIK